jgi:hypothetical protein
VVQQTHEIPISFNIRISWYKDWFLESSCRASPVHILRPLIPGEMANSVEQSSGGRATFLEVVLLRGINLQLPEMVVLLSAKPIIDPRELAADTEKSGWFDMAIGFCFGVKDPAESI